MFKRMKRLSALIAAASIAAFAGTPATAQTPDTLTEYPILTVGDLVELSESHAVFYVIGMLETSALITATESDDFDVARCIASQTDRIMKSVRDSSVNPELEMSGFAIVVAIMCEREDFEGDEGLIGIEEYDEFLGPDANGELRAMYLMGSRDFLIEHLSSGDPREKLVCIADAYRSAMDPSSAYSRSMKSDDDPFMVFPVVSSALNACY